MIEVASQGCISIVSTGLPQRRARAAHLRRHVCQKGNASENVFSPEKINGTQVKNKVSKRAVVWQNVDFIGGSKKKTLDVTCRFLMLDMRWKGLERLIRMSQVSAQGDAVFITFSRDLYPTQFLVPWDTP